MIGFTDGCCVPNPGKGRFAYILVENETQIDQYQSDIFNETTNNKMELSAIIALLEKHGNILKTVYSDSMYCVNGINDWRKKWKLKDYKLKKGLRPNTDLWKKIDVLLTDSTIEFKHIKAHTGKTDMLSKFNDMVDNLCNVE